MVRVKICGITSPEDAMAAVMLGADALGFVFAESPRRIVPDRAREIIRLLPPFVQTVGVFVNESVNFMKGIKRFCGLDYLQLHGEEGPETVSMVGGRVIKAIRAVENCHELARNYPTATLLFDTHDPHVKGGTGRCFDWSVVSTIARERPVILAGGLTHENVEEAIRIVSPYAVDVSSGVERAPGRKDHGKMELFICRAKGIKGSFG